MSDVHDCIARSDGARVSTPVTAVTAMIPHRPPFLLIDQIIEAEPGVLAVSSYYVDPALPVFAGHFPGNPVFPGVLLVENMAQTACWAMASNAATHEGLYVLARIVNCTFSGLVRPGDTLRTESRLARSIAPFAQFRSTVFVGDRKLAEAELLVARKSASPFSPLSADGEQPDPAHS